MGWLGLDVISARERRLMTCKHCARSGVSASLGRCSEDTRARGIDYPRGCEGTVQERHGRGM